MGSCCVHQTRAVMQFCALLTHTYTTHKFSDDGDTSGHEELGICLTRDWKYPWLDTRSWRLAPSQAQPPAVFPLEGQIWCSGGSVPAYLLCLESTVSYVTLWHASRVAEKPQGLSLHSVLFGFDPFSNFMIKQEHNSHISISKPGQLQNE